MPRGLKGPASVDGDAELMERAVALGESARRRTPPNPWVGCLLVRDGKVVGKGASDPPGGPHAEIGALAAAGDAARGATLYVTLEPCAHHGRTPPCTDALLGAGVRRVVVALEDPDPRVRGRGTATLREHGVDVELGVGAASARRSLAPYLHHRRTGRAYCVLKTATTLDGRTAAADGTSQWITGETARHDAHELRADSQAIVVGSGTALADLPALSVRGVTPAPAQPPLRVLLDARGRVPAIGPMFDAELGPMLVVTTEAAPASARDAWVAAGAKVDLLPAAPAGSAADGVGVDLLALLELLGRDGVLQALVEGGAIVHGSLVGAGLVDRVVAYVAPMLLGQRGRAVVAWDGPPTLADADHFELESVGRCGEDVRLDYARPDEARVAEVER
jgi:diaminohydroxyphosphoribosylaminopyrimidine deaminase/5-amino-6-(5-phosphoribosylamino)uracil reductase